MHSVPEVFNPPREPIYCVVPPPLVKIVRPQFAVRFIAGKHMKDTPHDRMCHRNDSPLLPTPCSEAMVECGEIRPLGAHRRMGELRQHRPQGAIALPCFARALFPRTFVIAWGHTGPRCQTGRSLKP